MLMEENYKKVYYFYRVGVLNMYYIKYKKREPTLTLSLSVNLTLEVPGGFEPP